jgi:hypothetical protein
MVIYTARHIFRASKIRLFNNTLYVSHSCLFDDEDKPNIIRKPIEVEELVKRLKAIIPNS